MSEGFQRGGEGRNLSLFHPLFTGVLWWQELATLPGIENEFRI
jgi:hypothetical protein